MLVRERLAAGDTDAQVRDFLVARYGSFILLRPPLAPATVLLWLAPLLCLALGGTAILVANRRRRAAAAAQRPLDANERAALERLTGEG